MAQCSCTYSGGSWCSGSCSRSCSTAASSRASAFTNSNNIISAKI